MPRVASLYLPDLAVDRLRRADRRAARARPPEPPREAEAPVCEQAALPPAPTYRWADGAIRIVPGDGEEASSSCQGGWRPGAQWAAAGGDRVAEIVATKARARARLQAAIDRLPLHQRPSVRELGRRSEAAPVPFRAMPADEVGGLLAPDSARVEAYLAEHGMAARDRPRLAREGFLPDPGGTGAGSAGPRHAEAHAKAGTHVRYDLQGAFWHTGRTMGGVVRKATEPASPSPPQPSATPLPPLVTATREGSRTLLAAACPAARALGLAPGQALSLARATVPELDVREADPAGDRAFLDRLARFAARRWTPGAAVSPPDGLWLDLTGAAHLHGGEARFCRRLVRFFARSGFAARVAVADTAAAAHALARHKAAPVTLCPPGAHGQALALLPVAALRIGQGEAEALRRLGMERIGDLLAMPRAPLARRFGRTLVLRLDQATGAAPEPIAPVVLPGAPRATRRLLEPIGTAEAIAQVIDDLVHDLCASLGERGLGVRRLLLTCRRVDGADLTVAIGTARPTRDPPHLARLLNQRIETIEPGFGIEEMALAAWRVQPLRAQALAGDLSGEAAPPDLAPLVDRLAGRLGARRLFRLAAVESDVPERSVARIAPLEAGAGWPLQWPRPVRLLSPPERVEHVIAELPDHPPRRFTWRGRAHQVVAGDGPERVFGEWWRATGEADAVRDYFRVEDADGQRFWLFRRGDGLDGRTGDLSWHMQGLFG